MNDDDVLKWKNLAYKISLKYNNINPLYDLEDLLQLAYIGLYKGLKTYNGDITLVNWLASNISWSIKNELRKCQNELKTISIEKNLTDNLYLIETIKDNCNVVDIVMEKVYLEEARKVLEEEEYKIFLLKHFYNIPYGKIKELLGEDVQLSKTLSTIKNKLIKKSYLYRNEYFKMHNLTQYSNPYICFQ